MLVESKTTGILLAQVPAVASRSELGWELGAIAAGFALLAIAAAAIALFFFRRRSRELTLIYFGLFCILYAVRLLLNARLFRSLFSQPEAIWIYVDWTITCVILIPLTLFLLEVAEEGFRKLLRWMLAAQIAAVVLEIAATALGVSTKKLHVANNFVVLGTVVSAAVFWVVGRRSSSAVSRISREFRIFLLGFVIWLVFVVHANLVGLKILQGQSSVEFVGFLVFVGSLGYISASRVFSNEERLLAIDKELEIARRIQFSIIPRDVPKQAGLEVAARYLPMSAVAGDFYDFLCVDDKRVGVLVADVTGHGVPAALIASMLKVAFAGQGAHAHDPARVLEKLNQALCGKFEEHFVTAAYLFLDLEQRVLRYSGAGHPPLVLSGRNPGNAREIEENGLMLGMFPEAVYSAVEIGLAPADRCVLYTDGVLEAKNADQEEFGKARLLKFVEAHGSVSAKQMTDDLLEEIARWSVGSRTGGKHSQEDDITVVTLDFLASQ